jgi:protein-tyrosine kinase
MSSLIELAVKRLQELRRAGIELPGDGYANSHFGHSVLPDDLDDTIVEARAPMPQPASGRVAQQAPSRAPSAERLPSVIDPPLVAEARVIHPAPARQLEVDLARLAGMGYLVPSQAQSLLADLLRVIKRPLLQNMYRPPEHGGPTRRSNVVVVTSAVPGEGKTFVATNLAMSIAMEIDHDALLVDGDVLRPSVFSRLNLEPQTGLMDLLVHPTLRTSELLVGTNVPKLTLLSAGTAQDRAEELLASTAMDQLLDELSAVYSDRLIIIDSPPLLVTTESRALAERAGQVVLVVEADNTPREQISRAFDTLSNCPIVMSVLNKSRAIESDYVYGY